MARPRRRTGSPSARHRFQVTRAVPGPMAGPGIVTSSLADLERALRAQPDEFGWNDVAANVIPVMPRIRAYPDGFPTPLRVIVDPGVAIGFAIDIGPGFMAIGPDLIRSWDISIADVQARALINTAERAARIRASSIHDGSLAGVPTRWLQTGQSIGSVLVLIPDELRRIFGPEPAFFITPMRDLIVGLPPDVERELAAWLWLEIASDDPNCLGPIGYRFDGRTARPEPLDPVIPAWNTSAGPDATLAS